MVFLVHFRYNLEVHPFLSFISIEALGLGVLIAAFLILTFRQFTMPPLFYEREVERAKLRLLKLSAEAYAQFKRRREEEHH